LDDFYGKDGKKELSTPTHQQPMTADQRQEAIHRVFGDDSM